MTKYRLKKDLPILKTGAIFELHDDDGYRWLSNDDTDASYQVDSIDSFDEWFEEVEEFGRWRPKYDEKYFYIGHDGFVYSCTWDNDELDNGRLELGLVFKTEEAGIRCRDYLGAVTTVRQDEGVLTPEQINGLIKNEDLAYYVGYAGNRGNGEALCGCTMSFEDCWMPVGAILFDTEEHAQASLDKHPDEWKIITNYDWSRE